MYGAPPGFDPHHSQTMRQKFIAFVQVVLLGCVVMITGLLLVRELGAYWMEYPLDLVETIMTLIIFVVSSIGLRIMLTRFSRPLK